MYLALLYLSTLPNFSCVKVDIPFGRIPLLLNLCEDAFCLVVDAVRALGHLAVALDLLLPAHIAGLQDIISVGTEWISAQQISP
jgi:hypothetical protein